MQIAINAMCLGLGALGIYGLTRDKALAWGRWLAGGCFAIILLVQITSPDDGCHTDWDGHSNPTVCD